MKHWTDIFKPKIRKVKVRKINLNNLPDNTQKEFDEIEKSLKATKKWKIV